MNIWDEEIVEGEPDRRSVSSRIITIIALSIVLVGALHWAMNITQANARQVSGNLTSIERHLDAPRKRNVKSEGPVVDFPGETAR